MLSTNSSTSAHAGRLVHLAEDECRLGQHAGGLHLVVHVVALARPLPHAREDRAAFVLVGDVADELLHDDRLAGAGAAEEADLGTFREGADQVDDLDPGLEDLHLGLLLRHRRREAVDRPAGHAFRRGLVIDRRPDDIEHASQRLDADRHGDRLACGDDLVAATETIGGVHRDAPDHVVADCSFDLEHDNPTVSSLHLERFV
jgi:hypothetical protein